MKKTTVLIIPGIIALIPSGLAIVFTVKLFNYNAAIFSQWLGLAYWALVTLIMLFTVWIVCRYYLKLVKILNKQQIKKEKLNQDKELALSHNQYRVAIDQSEYQLKKEKTEKEDRLKAETLRSENLLKLVDKLFDRKEKTKTKEGKETKTVTVNFRKELLEEVKLVKKEWDKMMNDET
jgi:hypothetical protein